MTEPSGDEDGEAAGARPVKRSFTVAGHKTSISLEAAFWDALREAAEQERTSLAGLVRTIDASRDGAGLSSAVRVWLLDYVRGRNRTTPTPEGES